LSAVSSKGEVTLPLKIRKAFGINPKDKVQILIRDDEIILEPVKSFRDLS
jgi:AbrB family looped-hinge helix DNA binding protein